MSELEKAIDQKLADARKASEVDSSQKKEEPKKDAGTEKSASSGEKKVAEPKIKKEDVKKVASSGDKKEETKKGTSDRKDGQTSRSGGDRKDDPKKGSSGDSRRTPGSDRRGDDHRRGSGNDRRDDRRTGTSNRDRERERDRDDQSRNGSKSARGDDGKKDSKPGDKKVGEKDKGKDDKGTEVIKTEIKQEPVDPEEAATDAAKKKKKKNKRPKVTLDDGVDWDITRDFGTDTNMDAEIKEEIAGVEWSVLSEDNEQTQEIQDKEKSRDRSTTPPWSTRHKVARGRAYRYEPPSRRSPPSLKRRSRSRELSRRRSRSPVRKRSRSPRQRRSPSSFSRNYRAPSRRYSPKRSRSPSRRRSRSRSRHDRSRSKDRGANPKALLAKKSFLDDLAVKFAQEGKEFPELEQYRCEINNQFSSRSRNSQFMPPHPIEHVAGCSGGYMGGPPQMGMPMMPPSNMYNAAPYPIGGPEFVEPIVESPPILPYPGTVMAIPSPPVIVPLEAIMTANVPSSSLETIMPENKVAVSDLLLSRQPSFGLQAEPVPETGFPLRGDVKTRITQAVELLDDLALAVRKSGKFMYRSQTYYESNIDENRSPILQGPNNPRYSFNSPPGESNDPFGNIPKNIKPVIQALCLDEGKISERIFLRKRKNQLAATLKKKKKEMEARKVRAQLANVPRVQLQKTTQTDPTVCTECLIRKLKFRATAETQTSPVSTVDSVAQTNPMPVSTITEFGSITELTPNQVRAVSELIRYIKLTATTGSVEEMRSSMIADQMYNVNSDLRTAYQYFDGMVEHKNNRIAPAVPPQQIIEDIDEPPMEEFVAGDDDDDGTNVEHYDNDDDKEIDEYEEYHQNFCEDNGTGGSSAGNQYTFAQNKNKQYHDPKTSFQQNPLAPYGYGTEYLTHAGGRGAMGPRGKFAQPRGGRGRGGKKNARRAQANAFNRR